MIDGKAIKGIQCCGVISVKEDGYCNYNICFSLEYYK